jgi:hypothetical protein
MIYLCIYTIITLLCITGSTFAYTTSPHVINCRNSRNSRPTYPISRTTSITIRNHQHRLGQQVVPDVHSNHDIGHQRRIILYSANDNNQNSLYTQHQQQQRSYYDSKQIGFSRPFHRRKSLTSSALCLSTSDDKNKNTNNKSSGLNESVRTKLVSESIAPWRTLRLFLYFSLGSGAFIGGLITLSGFLAILSGAKEGSINTEVCRCCFLNSFLILSSVYGSRTVFEVSLFLTLF